MTSNDADLLAEFCALKNIFAEDRWLIENRVRVAHMPFLRLLLKSALAVVGSDAAKGICDAK